jgi:hypothetical protein
LYSVYFIDSNTGWAVGSYGTILKATDGGENWISQISGTSHRSVYFIDSNTGWIVGDGGTILKTTDGGNNWISQISGNASILYSVYLIDSNTGWAVGDQGTIIKTTNGGNNWHSQSSGTSTAYWLNSVYFTDPNTGWIVGSYGTILKTTDSGGPMFLPDENEVLNEFSLFQNYPNPFNPSTTIRYQITKTEFVTLKVYDILGRDVATLVNEEEPAGSYEVQFNSHSGEGRNLTSGIYFYQIKAGEYSETKKMILLK